MLSKEYFVTGFNYQKHYSVEPWGLGLGYLGFRVKALGLRILGGDLTLGSKVRV